MSLRADVFIAPPIPFRKPNGSIGGTWSPCSCTLIHGPSSALLVDTAITNAQNEALANWIKARLGPGKKKLTTIYITHGHGDHFFGIGLLTRHFPGVKVCATRGTVEHMKQQIEPASFVRSWGTQFKGEIDEDFKLAEALKDGEELFVDGHVCRPIEVGQADTHDSTVLWVPDLKLAACGDVVYGDVHQMLGECDTREKRMAWVQSVEKVERLKPEIVVPGHVQSSEILGSFHLAATKKYILDFQGFVDSGEVKNARELTQKMTEAYPTRFNSGALIMGSMAAFRKPAGKSRM